MRCCWLLSETTRGAREGAPRRDITMTQNSDSGDAVGRRGTYNRQAAIWLLKVKKRFMEVSHYWANSAYGTSAADLKFLQRAQQVRPGTSNRKAALEL